MNIDINIDEHKARVLNNKNTLPDIKVSDRFKGLKVLGLVADTSACGYYRIVNPLHMLRMHGADVEYGASQDFSKFMAADIIIAPRQHTNEIYEIINQARWRGKHVIAEIDDDLHSVDKTSKAYIAYHPGAESLKGIDKVMGACDGVTVTTQELARWYYRNNRNVAIIDNYIDFSFRNWACDVTWNAQGFASLKPKAQERLPEWENKIVFGYSFGSTHQMDMLLIGKDVYRILKEFPNSHFAICSTRELVEEFITTFNIPRNRVSIIPPRHFLDYPEAIHGWDISLAPLVACQFNLCKSALKFYEASALGHASVLSNVGPYARAELENKGIPLLVGDGQGNYGSFYSALKFLIQNPEELASRKQKSLEMAYSKYSLEHNFQKWPIAWKSIIDNKIKGIIGKPEETKPLSYYKSYARIKPNEPCWCNSGNSLKACHGSSHG